jgi:hypothetical protein
VSNGCKIITSVGPPAGKARPVRSAGRDTLCPDDVLKGQLRDRACGQVQESATVKHAKCLLSKYRQLITTRSGGRAPLRHQPRIVPGASSLPLK